MTNDGEVRIGTKIDESGLDKGIKSVNQKLSGMGKSSAAKGIANIGSSIAKIGVASGAAVLAVSKAAAAIKGLSAAYNTQATAEAQLASAAENNPYLTGESVRALKDYASRMQGISAVGDEEILPLMAQLAAAGRTQSEIQRIMSASLDVSASGAMSLESAVRNLNKTFSGLSGELGESVPQVKELTAEQLKNGEAVEVIAQRYRGMAKAVADGTGGWKKFQNSLGDFKEVLGSGLAKAQNAAGNVLSGFFDALAAKIKGAKNEAKLLNEELAAIGGMGNSGNSAQLRSELETLNGTLETLSSIRATKSGKGDFLKSVRTDAKNAEAELAKAEKEMKKFQKDAESWRQKAEYEQTASRIAGGGVGAATDRTAEALNDAEKKLASAEKTLADAKARYSEARAAADDAEKSFDNMREVFSTKYKGSYSALDRDIEATTQKINEMSAALEKATDTDREKEAARTAEEARKKADDYARESNARLQESLAALEAEAKAKGEAVSAQDKYNVYLQSYIDLLTKTEGAIREGYPVEQKRLEQLKEARKAVDEAADAEKKLAAAIQFTQAASDAIGSASRSLTPAEELEEEIRQLDDIKAKIEAMSEAEVAAAQAGEDAQLSKAELIAGLNEAERQATLAKVDAITATEQGWWDKHASRQQELLEMKQTITREMFKTDEEYYAALQALDESYAASRKQQFADLATEIKGYTDQAVSIMQDASNLMLETVKNQATAEQAELELKYRKGEISEEEYNKKVAESKKKAAKEQYKIQMWQWSASILQATANIAQGISAALTQIPPASYLMAAATTAAGAVQIASIIASKPVPPSFAGGGIVPGNSYSGDRVRANVNSGEMILNAAQQRSLWEAANGRGAGGGANIVIHNSASNVVRAQPQITKDQIEILIDARVNDSLKNGRYDSSLNMAQQGMGGDYYGI